MRGMIRLPWETPMSKEWADAYKGNGAYYTCKNLIMFHGCKYEGTYNRDKSMLILEERLGLYKGEGWRMFAFMKKLIADNGFDFSARMKEIYNK